MRRWRHFLQPLGSLLITGRCEGAGQGAPRGPGRAHQLLTGCVEVSARKARSSGLSRGPGDPHRRGRGSSLADAPGLADGPARNPARAMIAASRAGRGQLTVMVK